MRILIAHSFYRIPGGEDRYVRQQLELLGTDHEVALISRDNSNLKGAAEAAHRTIYSRREITRVEEEMHAFGPDLVHVHNVYPSLGPAVHLACKRLKIPLVMTVHNYRLRCPNGYMFTEHQKCRRCTQGNYTNAVIHKCFESRSQAAGYATGLWLHRFAMRTETTVDMFVAPSRFMASRLLDWGFDAARVTYVPNFTSTGPVVGDIAGERGVFVGRMSSEKGLDVLLEALAAAADPPFAIVGDGPFLEPLQARAAKLKLAHTSFTGRVGRDSLEHLLGRARYMVIPSLWDENAPLAALEGLAAGLPLLVSATGGLPELAGDGRGKTFPTGDVHALAELIRRWNADPALCRQMGERARRFALAEFDARVHQRRLEDVYGRVLGI